MRIALVGPQGIVPESNPNGKMLLDALGQLGYIRSKNLIFETSAEDAPRDLSPQKCIDAGQGAEVSMSSWSGVFRSWSPRRLPAFRPWSPSGSAIPSRPVW